MNERARTGLAVASVLFVVAGCGGGGEPSAEDADAIVAAGTSVQVHGCTYKVATVTDTASLPPTYRAVVDRLPSPRCEAGRLELPAGPSYLDASPLITGVGEQGFAVVSRFKGTPSGSAAVAAEIAGVATDLTVVRTAELRTLAGLGQPTASVNVTTSFSKASTLVVEGTETGTFGPGGAAGGHFTAAFPRFLSGSDPPVIAVKP